jgi:uncharacterized membrane protein YkvA (DUF1232 family)
MAGDEDRGWWGRLRDWARALKRDVMALWLAARDTRTPMLAKVVAAAVAAYALSPIDLIPDIVPVLGYLDDVIVLPLGILLAIRLIPPTLMSEFRRAAERQIDRPTSRAALSLSSPCGDRPVFGAYSCRLDAQVARCETERRDEFQHSARGRDQDARRVRKFLVATERRPLRTPQRSVAGSYLGSQRGGDEGRIPLTT